MAIRFFVEGIPIAQGSKKAFMRKGAKFPTLVESAKGLKPWRERVALEGKKQLRKLSGPVKVQLEFLFPRAKSHFGTGRNSERLKESAPAHHTKKPDIDKVTRAILDAITNVVIEDDSCVVQLEAMKRYCSEVNKPGCLITVEKVL
ncbi:MAG: RusA family crossover junction endodeoxyribonuclease [Planctomycetaceae bacterium]|nr:RusA family crossover junction endodeoxyribonuclease [Planctomycetaceae bacterium]